ncbi:MAG: acetylxylan esterase, partial [Verrucomicrobia bacterium]|nr:acetylxylan esterase [Verrucomicrobiota bacterium]
VVPNHRRGAVPAFLGLSFCGNYAEVNDPHIPLPSGWMYGGPGVVNHRATEAGRGSQIDTWNLEQSIDRGYAVVTFYNGDIEPDDPATTDGIRSWYARHDAKASYDWGAVAAWAWGLSRALDYLVTDGDIDPRRIAVVGHSRNGKAAMLAAAFDERFALAIPLQAGCGGTSPSRGHVGESVRQINDHFPHWFNAQFKQFNDQVDRLPFDQHCLIALCAPRPVLLSCATEDTWANPVGQFEMLQAADPVYRLLGVEGVGAKQMPETGRLQASRLGYFIRPGKHSMTRIDWQAFLDYADKFLARRASDSTDHE